MSINAAQTQQTDPAPMDIDNVLALSSRVPVPGIKTVISSINQLIKLFTPSTEKEIEDKLDNINEQLEGIYGLMVEAVTEVFIKDKIYENVGLLHQIEIELISHDSPRKTWDAIKPLYREMAIKYDAASRFTNDFLKDYETANRAGSGYLIQYIGKYANAMCQFYNMYALMQYTTNILVNENFDNEWLINEQKSIISCVTAFLNRALGENDTSPFNFEYPSWCKNVFTQGKVQISSLDGRNMKYPADSTEEFICLSASYVKGTVCDEFTLSFVDIENPQGMWELMLQSQKTAGLKSITEHHGSVLSPTTNKFLLTDRNTRFIIKYHHTAVIICLEKNNKATSSHLGAEAHHARKVWATTKSYQWNIISLN